MSMKITQKQIKQLQKKILDWYSENKRELPWRETYNPYYILVSEVMLQQTQVNRVIPYFEKFIKRLPTIEKLARARKSTLLTLWSGLGFNSRVIRLQNTAKTIVNNYNGKFPTNKEMLLSLPGIGEYTSSAILAFAYNIETPVIDTNIRRVIIHELKLNEEISNKELQSIAKKLIPTGKSKFWHNALMDYGALKVTALKTNIKPISKQSKFKGSDREVRGFILKMLVRENEISKKQVKTEFPNKNVEKIIKKMLSEGIIRTDNENLMLPE